MSNDTENGEYRVHDVPCGECRHARELINGWICRKHLMAITANMHVTYGGSTVLCFEAKEPPTTEERGDERAEKIRKIKERHYECFIEDHESKPWTPGQCAAFAGRSVHLMRCKRRDGHGLGGLFCRQHDKEE